MIAAGIRVSSPAFTKYLRITSLNLNHALAGERLTFNGRILGIEALVQGGQEAAVR
jgi:hypothetical protein